MTSPKVMAKSSSSSPTASTRVSHACVVEPFVLCACSLASSASCLRRSGQVFHPWSCDSTCSVPCGSGRYPGLFLDLRWLGCRDHSRVHHAHFPRCFLQTARPKHRRYRCSRSTHHRWSNSSRFRRHFLGGNQGRPPCVTVFNARPWLPEPSSWSDSFPRICKAW